MLQNSIHILYILSTSVKYLSLSSLAVVNYLNFIMIVRILIYINGIF